MLAEKERILVETIFEEYKDKIKNFIGNQIYWYHGGDENICIYSTSNSMSRGWNTCLIDIGFYFNSYKKTFDISCVTSYDKHLEITMPIHWNLKAYFEVCLIFFKVFKIKPWSNFDYKRLCSIIER